MPILNVLTSQKKFYRDRHTGILFIYEVRYKQNGNGVIFRYILSCVDSIVIFC